MEQRKYKKLYLVTQFWSDGLPYTDYYGTDYVAVCETRELAEQIAKEKNEASCIDENLLFTKDEWNQWEIYMFDNYMDDEGATPFDDYDENEVPEIARKEELQICLNYMKEHIARCKDMSDTKIIDMILKQWAVIDSPYDFAPCQIEEIGFYYN